MGRQAGARGSLLRKYGLLVAAPVSGAVLTTGLSQAWFAYRDNEEALLATQRETAALAVSRIESFADGHERALRATILPVRLDAAEDLVGRRDELSRLLRQAPAFTEAAYLDALGPERMRASRVAVDCRTVTLRA